MKTVSQCFLFQPRPIPGLSNGRRAAFWAWNLGALLLASLGLGALSLMLATGSYPLGQILRGYLERPLLILLNLLPCVVLTFLLYGLTGRAEWAFLASSAVVLGLTLGNYYKQAFRDDPLMFADLLLLKEAGNMAGKYHLFLNRKIAAALVCVAAGWMLLHFLVRARPEWRGRVLSSLLAVTAAACLSVVYLDGDTYNYYTANYDHLMNRWGATQQYVAHGFLYPFLHSAGDAVEKVPAGYDKAEAAAILAGYGDADIPEDKKVNVVAVMLEAYNDFTRLGAPELAQDVYDVWHDLEDEGWSGRLVTNIFAGGTVDTERCFLTGCSTLLNYRAPTNSYVWYFRDQGYVTEGMHPSNEWFYNRANINEYLGFQNYMFSENYFRELSGNDTAPDCILFPALIREYQAACERGEPYFNFTVTYQGHGPYYDGTCWWGDPEEFVVNDGSYTAEQMNVMGNYFGSVADTNRYLKELTDCLRTDGTPVVLLLFGDHNPWMGDSNSVYSAMGIDFRMDTQEGFLSYYSTRYIIWANDAAKEVLGNDFRGEGPDLGPCFLMSELFRLCGWDGPAFMQAVDPIREHTPVLHATGWFLEDGTVTKAPNEADTALIRGGRRLEYYWRHNFMYG